MLDLLRMRKPAEKRERERESDRRLRGGPLRRGGGGGASTSKGP